MIRIIQDIHGNYDNYLDKIKDADYSIQLGDFGFDYDCLKNVDSTRHKILGGNHDNYDKIVNVPHYLGDYGIHNLGGFRFFFVRGAWSIDHNNRIPGISWWQNEELSYQECLNAIDNYSLERHSIVLSHDAPEFLYPKLGCREIINSRTNLMLNTMWHTQRPNMWFFGHHHKYFDQTIFGCRFISGRPCSYYNLEI